MDCLSDTMRRSVPTNALCRSVATLACAVLAFAANDSQKPKAGVQPSAPRICFENRQKASGVRFVLQNGTTEEKPILDSVPGGVALLDFDNDGYLDVFFTNGARIPSLVKDGEAFHNRLFHNNRDGTFTDIT